MAHAQLYGDRVRSWRAVSATNYATTYLAWCEARGLEPRAHDSAALWTASLRPLRLPRKRLALLVERELRPVLGDATQVVLDALEAIGLLG